MDLVGSLWAFIYEPNANGLEGECLGYIQLLSANLNYSVNTISQIDIEIPVNIGQGRRRLRPGLILNIYTDTPRHRLLTRCILQQRNRKLDVSEFRENWRCVDFLQELKNSSLGLSFTVDGLDFRGAIHSILEQHPGWSFSHPPDAPIIAFHLSSESVFTGIIEASEQAGYNFKLAVGRRHIVFLDRTTLSHRVIRHNSLRSANATREPVISSVSYNEDSAELYNRIIPYSGDANAPLTLERATITHPYPVENNTPSNGVTNYSISDPDSIQKYGESSIVLSPAYLVYPSANTDVLGSTNISNALYNWAVSKLDELKQPQETYEITIVNLQDTYDIIGKRVRLQYQGYLETEEWVSVDEYFSVTDVEQSFQPNQYITNLTLTNNGKRPRRPEDMLADLYNLESRSLIAVALNNISTSASFDNINILEEDEIAPAEGELIIRETTFTVPDNFIEIIRADLRANRQDTRTGPFHLQFQMDGVYIPNMPMLTAPGQQSETIDIYPLIPELFTRNEHTLGVSAVYGTGQLSVELNIVGTILQ